jgi:hypothetical protein
VLEPIELYWLNRRLDIATEEVRRLDPEMAMWELKQAFPGLQTISTTPSGNQIFHFPDRDLEVGPMASNAEIATALQNPFVRTENTRIIMASPLQGVGQKLGLLKHSAEANAKKIADKVDALAARMDVAVAKSTQHLDAQEKDIVDVETFVADIEKATNE